MYFWWGSSACMMRRQRSSIIMMNCTRRFAANVSNHTAFVRINGREAKLFSREWLPDTATANHLAPIILLHDSLGCVELWRDFPKQLSEISGRRVIAYDRLGFGLSDECKDVIPLTFIQDEAELFLPTILNHYQINQFIIFGHSVGGGMAVYCASKYSKRCIGLITESAQAFLEDRTVKGILDAKQAFQDVRQVQKLAKYHGTKTRWVLDSWIESWLHPEFKDWSLNQVLPTVACPVLTIHGERDEYGSKQHPDIITRLVKGPATLQYMENCGHVPHREKPKEVLEMINLFLSSIS